eukprot:353313-Chlamydomonas_euryale.AAC.2
MAAAWAAAAAATASLWPPPCRRQHQTAYPRAGATAAAAAAEAAAAHLAAGMLPVGRQVAGLAPALQGRPCRGVLVRPSQSAPGDRGRARARVQTMASFCMWTAPGLGRVPAAAVRHAALVEARVAAPATPPGGPRAAPSAVARRRGAAAASTRLWLWVSSAVVSLGPPAAAAPAAAAAAAAAPAAAAPAAAAAAAAAAAVAAAAAPVVGLTSWLSLPHPPSQLQQQPRGPPRAAHQACAGPPGTNAMPPGYGWQLCGSGT